MESVEALIGKMLEAQDQKLMLVLLIVLALSLLLAVPGFVAWVRNRSAREQREDAIEKLRQETDTRLKTLGAEMDAKREQAVFGVLSQLSDQGRVQLDVIQQNMRVLEETTALLKQSQTVIARQVEGIHERNRIQAESAQAIQANAEALKNIGPTVASVLEPALQRATQQLQQDIMQDAQGWVEGLKAEARGPLATIEGIPLRLDRHEQKIEQLIAAVPREVKQSIADDLRAVSDHLRQLSERIDAAIDHVPPLSHVVAQFVSEGKSNALEG